MTLSTVCHVLGGLGIGLDAVSLWMLGHRDSLKIRRTGILCMAGVNLLFAVQGVLLENWTLTIVSTMSWVLQTRAFINWKATDGHR
jgi:hypothetical protein